MQMRPPNPQPGARGRVCAHRRPVQSIVHWFKRKPARKGCLPGGLYLTGAGGSGGSGAPIRMRGRNHRAAVRWTTEQTSSIVIWYSG
jgi:hypothetical protein